ncbi:MAG: phosphate ABC transporter substrate-binding protein PstS [Fimbriimonadaceae bacterium]|nr:phosphate ABC transporter substrate-binding protein PstS [Fimbriimonadaceae bacterium]
MTRKKVLLGLATGLFLATSAAFAAASLNGAGATFPYPLYSKWIDVYAKATGVKINYQSIGSGGGIQQLKAKTVDFAGSDAPLSDAEQKEMPAKVLHIPTVFGAVAVAYNLPFARLYLDQPTLAGIFLGEIKNWSDPKIKALNKGITLPNKPILVAHRSDGSGTTYIFTDYLTAISPTWAKKAGKGKSVNWPVGQGGKGNEGVAALVKGNEGAIGYVELAYALKNGLRVMHLQNKAGAYLPPTLAGTTAAASGRLAALKKDIRASLVNADGKTAYPIVGATYLMVYQTQAKGETATELVKFLKWAITSGQAYAKDLLYAPLPADLVAINQKTIATIVQK